MKYLRHEATGNKILHLIYEKVNVDEITEENGLKDQKQRFKWTFKIENPQYCTCILSEKINNNPSFLRNNIFGLCQV